MITKHSIDLKMMEEPCFAHKLGQCLVLVRQHEGCGSYKCPFYKPKGCKAWIRLEDRTGINLIPPEDV